MYKRVLQRLNIFQYGVLTQDICLEVENMLTWQICGTFSLHYDRCYSIKIVF